MAKCDLSIELADGDRVFTGGETIRGIVRVSADKDVNCSGLELSTRWATHGRGNVDSKTTDSKIVFEGQWVAGEQKEYAFELKTGQWPPTYHGHYLNVDHYVEARAKIPWAFDPKASVPFQLQPTECPDEILAKGSSIVLGGKSVALIGIVFAAVFIGIATAIVATGGLLFASFFLVAVIIALSFVLVRFVLPKIALGNVHFALNDDQVIPGQQVDGELVVEPKKNVAISGVTLQLAAKERCVSGSGSNRKTHTHDIFDQTYTIADTTTLKANIQNRFPLSIQLPDDAPYSIDLDDNDLIWTATLRIDIPRWPDWRRTIPLLVVPNSDPSSAALAKAGVASDKDAITPAAQTGVSPAGEITFAETANHLWSVRDDREQTVTLVDAVTGLTLDLQAIVERRLLYAGDDDPHVYENGYAVWAHYPSPEVPMVLYVPHEFADEFEQIGRDVWQGRGTIVGFDARHGRLQVKLEP